ATETKCHGIGQCLPRRMSMTPFFLAGTAFRRATLPGLPHLAGSRTSPARALSLVTAGCLCFPPGRGAAAALGLDVHRTPQRANGGQPANTNSPIQEPVPMKPRRIAFMTCLVLAGVLAVPASAFVGTRSEAPKRAWTILLYGAVDNSADDPFVAFTDQVRR